MGKLQVRYVHPDELKPFEGNPRQISEKGLEKLQRSVEHFGFTNPILAQKSSMMIIAGHQRLKAAIAAGVSEVPVVLLDFDDEQAKAYNLADNRLNQESEWEYGALSQLLQELEEGDVDLAAIGFSDKELEELVEYRPLDEILGDEVLDEIPDELPAEPVTRPGDIWTLGDHRLMCGDCTDLETVMRLFGGQQAQMVITSPPYAEQRKDQYASIPADKYPDWFLQVAANVWRVLSDEGSFFVNIKEHCEDGQRSLYVMKTVIAMVEESGWRYVDQLIWYKRGLPGGWPNRLRDDFEPVHFFTKKDSIDWFVQLVELEGEPSGEHYGGGFVELGESVCHFTKRKKITFRPKTLGNLSDGVRIYDRSNKNVGPSGNVAVISKVRKGIARPGNVVQIAKNLESGVAHGAVFPVKLPAFFISLTTDTGDIVYEPFAGSGTTIIAAEKMGRKCYGMELAPAYCDLAARRWEKITGKKAWRSSGQS